MSYVIKKILVRVKRHCNSCTEKKMQQLGPKSTTVLLRCQFRSATIVSTMQYSSSDCNSATVHLQLSAPVQQLRLQQRNSSFTIVSTCTAVPLATAQQFIYICMHHWIPLASARRLHGRRYTCFVLHDTRCTCLVSRGRRCTCMPRIAW